jgi:branched-chain amino acid transport system ATP-binding protein
MTASLEIRGLSKNFGALQVCRDIDLSLQDGARHALIGPNGAGKTTLVNLIAGALPATSGRILLDGADITALPQAPRVRRGLARTFQINQLFRNLSVLENVCLAISERNGTSRNLWRPLRHERALLDEAMAQLDALGLAQNAGRPVNVLPYGQQRLVEIAIALALRPRLLLLDEPAAGVPSAESHLILDALEKLDPRIPILIIEHDMDIVFRFAKRVSVLVAGRIMAEASPQDIARDENVRAAYLGRQSRGVAP